jgi:small-conductance mechanosensitive channel
MDIITYHHEFRTALFTSSLTLGTFLFTMKTFIIQTIKKEIYDQPIYKAKIENEAKLSGKSLKYYRSLRLLSRLIFFAIIAALINAFLQITLGYVDCAIAAYTCLLSSFFSWFLFALVLFQVGNNMSDMLAYAEEDSQNKTRERLNKEEQDKNKDKE